MTQVLWPDTVRLLQTQRLWPSKELIPENPSWLIVHHLSHRDRQPKSCLKSREPASAGLQKFSRDSVFPEIATYDNQALTRKPLETVAFRRPSLEARHASNVQTFPKSSSDSTANQTPLLLSQQAGSSLVRQSNRKIDHRRLKRSNCEQPRRATNPVNKELKALLVANERWNRDLGTDGSPGKHSSQSLSPVQHVVGINNDIFYEKLPEVNDTVQRAEQKYLETDCAANVGEEVVVPSWRIVKAKRRYVIEQTENLGDEVFALRHQKPEIDEKRRKRWDEQRLRDLKLLERLQNRKDQLATIVQAVTTPPTISTDNESRVSHIKVIEAEPILAFGHFIASIPPREFSLPRGIMRRSKTAAKRNQTSCSSRKRNWK